MQPELQCLIRDAFLYLISILIYGGVLQKAREIGGPGIKSGLLLSIFRYCLFKAIAL